MQIKNIIHNFWEKKYGLIVRNNENLAEKLCLSFSFAKLSFLFLIGLFSMLLVSSVLIRTFLSYWFNPNHLEEKNKQKIEQLAHQADSLSNKVLKQMLFIQQLQHIIHDSAVEEVSSDFGQILPKDYVQQQFFKKNSALQYTKNPLYHLQLIQPVAGIITEKFNPFIDHFGIDIVANTEQPILNISDGIVIFASWTIDTGWVIVVQHTEHLVSIYKHNTRLCQEVGNFVKQGTILATLGNSGELSTGPHLHFELWYEGNAVDPEKFINF